MSGKEFVYMIIVFFIMQMITVFQYFAWGGEVRLNSNFTLFFISSSVFFPLFGYFIERKVPLKYYTRKNVVVAGVIGIVAIIACCMLTTYHCKITQWQEGSCQQFFTILIFIPAGAMYFGLKYYFDKHQVKIWFRKILTAVGSCTFGMYLFEHIYRNLTSLVHSKLVLYVHPFLATFVWLFAAFTLGFCVTFILKRIPIIKKLL